MNPTIKKHGDTKRKTREDKNIQKRILYKAVYKKAREHVSRKFKYLSSIVGEHMRSILRGPVARLRAYTSK